MAVKSKYESLYRGEDKTFLINDLDPDSKTIEISLPSAPKNKHLIDGYGLHPDEQYFMRTETPKRLQHIEKKVLQSLQEVQKQNKQEPVTGYKIIHSFWRVIEENPEEYEPEIDFIKKIWWYRLNGYWFYNDGKPTYITGRHFAFLNYFYQPDIKSGNGYPEYRDRHRREYLFRDYLRTSTESFARRDEKGMAIPEDDGSYKMVDMGVLLSFGDIHPKSRRNGSTMMGLSDMIEDTERKYGAYSTIISKDGESTEKHFQTKLLPAWSSRPYYIRPIWQGSASPNQIKYYPPRNAFSDECLMGVIDYTMSAGEIKQDGNKINGMLVADEEGKCLAFGTKVVMMDGSIKKVEDVVDGDLLMGDDGTPRRVSGCVVSKGKLYRVDTKFGSFVCNRQHILSLRSSYAPGGRSRFPFEIPENRIVNIPIEQFIALSDSQKKNLKVYRAPILYKEADTLIDPYIMGVYIGDGSVVSGSITVVDKDIISALESYAEEKGMTATYFPEDIKMTLKAPHRGKPVVVCDLEGNVVSQHKSIVDTAAFYSVTTSAVVCAIEKKAPFLSRYSVFWGEQVTPLSSLLRQDGVLFDKKIPDNYLKNSREKRMQLLAGLIDSDGSRPKNDKKLVYEIIQKKEVLANQACSLANSLGFYSSISPKTARMKREDGSTYECLVYRVRIYGDLYTIPVKVSYKKYKEPTGFRNKTPNTSWLTVSECGEGWYAGFELDGNHLFLLANQIVTHNTHEAQILTRHNVNRNAQSLGDGSIILGYSSHISTVEEISQAGEEFLELLGQSLFYQRGDNGQTLSGLMAMFFPSYDGQEGFIDRWGMSVIENPTERQIALAPPQSVYPKIGKGAKQYQQEKRDDYANRGTASALRSLREYIKKYPWRTSELYMGTSGDLGFNYDKMDTRLAELRRLKSTEGLPIKIGNFYRVNNDPEGDVYWKTEPDKGKFMLAMDLPRDLTNLKRSTMGWDVNKGNFVPMWEPLRKTKFTVGADPVEFDNTDKTTSGSRQSDGGVAVLWERDEELDRSENPADWDSYRCVLYYRHRPASLSEYCEDVIMTAEYFSCLIFPENNKTRLWEYIIERGRGGYLKYQIDPRTGKRAEKPGWYATAGTKNTLFGEWKDYIENRIHKEVFIPLIEEARNIRSMDEMKKYDGFAAFGAALVGSKSPDGKAEERMANMEIDLGGCNFLQSRPM